MTETPDRPAQELTADPARQSKRRRKIFLVVLLVACCSVVSMMACGNSNGAAPVPTIKEPPGGVAKPPTSVATNSNADYSKFTHEQAAHSRLPCLLCHRRDDNSAIPVRSQGHTPCAGCHAQQFQQSTGPLCTVCHVNVEAGNRAIKPFPTLKRFDVVFDHAKHRGVSCAKCHRPERGGVAQSIPQGFNAHATCYECHSPKAQSSEGDISSCATCHKPGQFSRTPEWSKAYGVSFSHAKHSSRERLNCNACHSIRPGITADVSSPAPLMHRASSRAQSCMTCHNGKRAFGEEFASCKKCHQGETFRF